MNNENCKMKKHLSNAIAVMLFALMMILPNGIVFADTPNDSQSEVKSQTLTTVTMESSATKLTTHNNIKAHSIEPNSITVYKNKESQNWVLGENARVSIQFDLEGNFKNKNLVFGYVKDGVYKDFIKFTPNAKNKINRYEKKWVALTDGEYSFYLKSKSGNTDIVKVKNLTFKLDAVASGVVLLLGRPDLNLIGYNPFGQEASVEIDLDKTASVAAGYLPFGGERVEVYRGKTKNVRFNFTAPEVKGVVYGYYVQNLSSTLSRLNFNV